MAVRTPCCALALHRVTPPCFGRLRYSFPSTASVPAGASDVGGARVRQVARALETGDRSVARSLERLQDESLVGLEVENVSLPMRPYRLVS